MKVRILQSAVDDLGDGAAFYEELQPGIGGYFIDALALYGGIHRIIRSYHRALSKRFPYAIYHRIDAEWVVVHAVLDCRRNPRWTAQQLRRQTKS